MATPEAPTTKCELTFRPSFVRRDRRGTFLEVVRHGPWQTVITGSMCPGAVLGNHYHRRTRMVFFLIRGEAMVSIVGVDDGRRRRVRLTAGEGAFLEPNMAHAIRFLTDADYLLLKSEPYDADSPDTYPYPVERSET